MKKWLSLIITLFLLLPLTACGEPPPPPPVITPSPTGQGVQEWLRQDILDLEEARLDPDFGAFVPTVIPGEFYFVVAARFVTPDEFPWWHPYFGDVRNGLSMGWDTPSGTDYVTGSISLLISEVTEHDLTRIVSADNREAWETDSNPVFLAEELTPDIVEARVVWFGDRWWTTGLSVLFGDVLVQIYTIGVSPEQVWAMLAEIGAG